MKQFILLIVFCSFVFANENKISTLKVATSANLSSTIKKIIVEFNKIYPHIEVRPIISSSGKLATQILHLAPYDLFLSADMKYPNAIFKSNLSAYKPKIYTRGSLVLLNRFNDFKLDNKVGLHILLSDKIKKISIANPKTAPYGKASIEALKKIKIYKNIKHKFVFANSISQSLHYTVQSTNIGIVANSVIYSTNMSSMNYIKIPSTLHSDLNQGIVLLKKSKNKENAKIFYDFIFSKKAQDIFVQNGYLKI